MLHRLRLLLVVLCFTVLGISQITAQEQLSVFTAQVLMINTPRPTNTHRPPRPTRTPKPTRIPRLTHTPTPSPTRTFTPTPSVTSTPFAPADCDTSQVSVRWVGFEYFGIVRLEVVNNRNVGAELTDFNIQWIQRLPGIITLDRVTVVAQFGQPGSVEIWNSGSPTQDLQPPTSGHNDASDPTGTWVQNFTFPPQSVTPLLLDFGGTTGVLSYIGVTPSDFAGTKFSLFNPLNPTKPCEIPLTLPT